ncbi:MAG TPA: signal recognition particle protein [Nitrospiria bacterium]|jgi:signal recognition particle subunit SRP54
MLDQLSSKLDAILKRLKIRGVLTEENITEALKEVRLALLEADVHYRVVKDFISGVKEKAVGQDVLKSLTPGQQVVKVVWDELRRLMGEKESPIRLNPNPPTVILLAGLYGAGKTTTAGKLGVHFKNQGKKVLLAAVDVHRPAAEEQLKRLGEQGGVDVQGLEGNSDPVFLCLRAMERGERQGYDLVILDTAGRLHVEEDLIQELQRVKEAVKPHEILLVADAMTGQDAVQIAEHFHGALGLSGVILTKMEGDGRGGAVLSLRAVSGAPVKYVGLGERLEQLEVFYPDRMASRVLGMGDVLSLIEKAQESFTQEQAVDLEKKLKSSSFTLGDFAEQMKQVRKLGSINDLLAMIPGGQRLQAKANTEDAEREIIRVEAIINSMTKRERLDHTIINGSRRKRIARGSGSSLQEINRLIKNFLEARRMMKVFSGKGKKRALARFLPSF